MTRHETVTDEVRDAASLYSLGLLDPDEAQRFEAHLNACPLCKAELRACNEVLADVALSAPAVRPRPKLKEELLRRTLKPAALVRAGEGDWLATPFPGVEVKQLFVDPVTQNVTSLLRLGAGAVYPPHRHAGFEHCYVIEGDVLSSDHTLFAGDYEVNAPNSDHSTITSKHGCLLLIINNQRDRLLA
jgi:quercetin dioxygenase-like cupin family protein